MNRIITLFLFVFLICKLSAQSDFKPGYIINLNNDTLRGLIDNRSGFILTKKCTFKASVNDTAHIYLPGEIKSFRLIDGKYYITKSIESTMYFMEYLLEGKINLYCLQTDPGYTKYYMEKDPGTIVEIPYSEEIKKNSDGNDYLRKSKTHVGLLEYYMSDASQLFPQIEKIEIPSRKNLIRIAHEYHTTVCDSQRCIIYEKSLPKIQFSPQLVGGVSYFISEYNDTKYPLYTYGVLCSFKLSYVSENLYFKTGLSKMQSTFDKPELVVYDVPLKFEYLYPKGIIRPKIGGGLNIMIINLKDEIYYNNYSFRFLYSSLSTGANIMLSKDISIVLDYNIYFHKSDEYKVVPNKPLLHSFLIGLRKDL